MNNKRVSIFRKIEGGIVAPFLPYSKEILKSKISNHGKMKNTDKSAFNIKLADIDLLNIAFKSTYSSR